MHVHVEGPLLGQSARCIVVLEALPHWFGVAEANEAYAREIEGLPTFAARERGAAEQTPLLGFLSVKRHFPHAAEVYVLGVMPEWHRRGVGRALLERAEEWLRGEGIEYLQVKTQGPSREDAGYARTRAFYEAMGFRPLEELTTLWDESNPALIMVKHLGPSRGASAEQQRGGRA